MSTDTSAAMTLASISLTLSSLLGVWISNLPSKFFPIEMIYSNTSPLMNPIKYICLLTCFLLAFSCFVQSSRHFVHSNYLLSTPGITDKGGVKKVERAVQRGSEFWLLGLRALYFALNFLLWFFGPIPMFVSSITMVVILYCHDLRKSESDNLHDVLLISWTSSLYNWIKFSFINAVIYALVVFVIQFSRLKAGFFSWIIHLLQHQVTWYL